MKTKRNEQPGTKTERKEQPGTRGGREARRKEFPGSGNGAYYVLQCEEASGGKWRTGVCEDMVVFTAPLRRSTECWEGRGGRERRIAREEGKGGRQGRKARKTGAGKGGNTKEIRE